MFARKKMNILFLSFQILTDLVQGEFMQLGSKESENERFAHYLTKTYRKTASLIANTTKSVRNGDFNKMISRFAHLLMLSSRYMLIRLMVAV